MSQEEPGTSRDTSEEILLEIEGALLKCKKSLLVNNSDYFHVMLDGNFKEKNQAKITLKAVDLKAMSIIIKYLQDETYYIENEDILIVLQTCRMLQFNRLEDICVRKITNILGMSNCIKIWIVTEQLSLKPLCLKAKLLALDEFLEIKDTESVYELTLEQIVSYLGCIYIKTDTEYTIFKTAMNWLKVNYTRYTKNPIGVLLKLLSSIDFQEVDESQMNQILLHPEISSNNEITAIIKYVWILRNGELPTATGDEEAKEKAKLLLQTTKRKSPSGLCLLASTIDQVEIERKIKDINPDIKIDVVIVDGTDSSEDHPDHSIKKFALEAQRPKMNELVILCYDEWYAMFKKMFDVENHKCFSLEGFAIMGYKQQVFIYGGQYSLGKGDWNYNFYVWDCIQENMEKKAHFPYPRRHFDTCRIDNMVFICGGTGLFRIYQDNVFWYDYKRDIWSAQNSLPVPSDKQVKCCLFKDTLFVFSTITRCGYFFKNAAAVEWQKVQVEVNSDFFSNTFAIFSYKDKLYFKGKTLIEYTLEGDKMVAISQKAIVDFDFCKIHVVLVNSIVYTQYEYSKHYALESYNIETGEKRFIFRDLYYGSLIEADKDDKYVVTEKMRIFSCHRYSLVEGNKLINHNFHDIMC